MPAADRNPYVGPRAFTHDDADLFFGRPREIRDLTSLVIAHPAVLLYGASGAGKSSLLNAGVIPLLEKRGWEVIPPSRLRARIPDAIRGSDVDNVYVFNLLSGWAGPGTDPGALVHTDIAGFLARLPRAKQETGEPVPRVIVLDEFEDLFTFAPERWLERDGLIRQLAAVLDADPHSRTVLAIGEEFIARFETYARLLPQNARTRFHLEPLAQDAAREAIAGPLTRTTRRIDPDATRRLVEELAKVRVTDARGEPVEIIGRFVEPVQLQVVCRKLWESLPADVETITPAHLGRFGDVDEALTQFYEDALSAAATETGVASDHLRSWVGRYLITPGGTRGIVYRGTARTGSDEDALPNAAVDVLEEKYLIRAETRAGGERWYELTHDRFVGPVKEALRVWKVDYERRRRWRKRWLRGGITAGIVVAVWLVVLLVMSIVEYLRTDGAINDLLALHARAPELAEQKAPTVLADVATHLWERGKIDHLTKLLQRAEPVITEQYREDPGVGAVMPRVPDNAPSWPIELRYNPQRLLDSGRLLYQWRVVATQLVDTWGIPSPATLRLTEDDNVPVDDLVLVADNARVRIVIPEVPGFLLISEDVMPAALQTWFDAHKAEWVRVDALKYGGPWWLVPRWTQPLFEAAHAASPREAAIAFALGNTLIAQPELALNRHNVTYMLRRLEGGGFAHTVAEALAARGGIDGLVDDLRAVVMGGQPLKRLEYVLDSLAGYPKSQHSSAAVATKVADDQDAAARAGGSLSGPKLGVSVESLAELGRSEDILAYRDTGDRTATEPPIRVYLGRNLLSYFTTPEDRLRPQILEDLSDIRGEIFKHFGIVVPGVRFREASWDPVGRLDPSALRIELLYQRGVDEGEDAIKVANPEKAVEQFLRKLRSRLPVFRTWWITADYVDQQLEHNEELKKWLLGHYSLTDVKILLRGVVSPSKAEIEAYANEDVERALRHTVPGQSLRKLDRLLGSLVFWSQAYGLDTTQLVQALRDTQAARLAPSLPSSPARPPAVVLAGIEALKQRDFSRAEEQFRQALKADRRGAIAAFAPAYAIRDATSVTGELKELIEACEPFEPPGRLSERRSVDEARRFEIEDFLARHQVSIGDRDRTRLTYCLLERYAAEAHDAHVRATLKTLSEPPYIGDLKPDQKFALGYWTLQLSGPSADPPADLEVAENYLAAAFREWKETTDGESSALSTLYLRYGGQFPPRWYMDMLQRLGELRPKNFYVAHSLGDYLARGRTRADGDDALAWLKRARERLAAAPEADRPRLAAWIDSSVAAAYLTKARTGAEEKTIQEAAQEATSRLQKLIENLKQRRVINKEGWPGAVAYTALIDTYLFRNRIHEAAKTLDASRKDGLHENPALMNSRFTLLLAAGRSDEALRLADAVRDMPDFDRSEALFLAALSQLLTNQPEAEYKAREFLATGHEYRDYIRLMLYWHLAQQEKIDRARSYLDERWRGVNPDSWRARLARGDAQVWREWLIGYYLGKVKRDEIFAPLRDPAALHASQLGRIGTAELTYDGMRCEAYFYEALLQSVSGEPATRSARYAQALERVLEMGRGDQYEYLMAMYLRSAARR